MQRTIFAAAVAALLPLASAAQEAVGTLTLTLDDEERPFVLIQGAEGANPGTRYSTVGGDVVLTLVAVRGDQPMPPEEAPETVELRFTAAEDGAEVRTGSIVSHSVRDEGGTSSTRSGTAEVSLDELTAEEDGVSAAGTFSAQLPPDEQSAGTEMEGTFETRMKPREATRP